MSELLVIFVDFFNMLDVSPRSFAEGYLTRFFSDVEECYKTLTFVLELVYLAPFILTCLEERREMLAC